MSDNAFRLVTLGRLALLSPAGEALQPVSKRRRKLALLAYLALSRRAVSRDQLVEMFWGEQDERRARHSLSDALSELRGHLGADALEARSADLRLAATAPLRLDATEFATACDRGDFARAVELYRGEFLHGVVVEGSASFEDWLTRERDRLAQLFATACKEECAALAAAGRFDACAALAERWLDAAPISADAARALLESINAPGTNVAAQAAHAAYERLVSRLSRDYDMEPDPRVATIAARITESAAAASLVPDAVPSIAIAPHSSERALGRVLAFVGLGVIVTFGVVLARRLTEQPGATKPVVAVVTIRNLARDTAAAWLEDGLKQMITADLARNPAVDVVAPERVRDVLVRGGLAQRSDFTADELAHVGRDVGATWVVTGAFTRGDNVYVLDVSLRDVANGVVSHLYTVTGSDPPAVADAAAARVLDAADANGPGPRFAAVETSSLEAYQHYVRALRLGAEGHGAESSKELDAAVALDSTFVSALVARMRGAIFENNPALLARLRRRYAAARTRATPWDELEIETNTALHSGERARSEAMARDLVAHFPRDPRAYQLLADVYENHGRWASADTVLQQELALDSLATTAGNGPCAPCNAFSGLIAVRGAIGDLAGAERAARRWVALQPDIPGSWTGLSTVLSFEGQFDEALVTARRAAALAPEDAEYHVRIGRLLLMARRYDALDSALAGWRRAAAPGWEEEVLDLQALLEREHGRYRASIATLERLVARHPSEKVLRLEEANSLGRIGRYAEARRMYESGYSHSALRRATRDLSPGTGLSGDEARAFCWSHALEAEAVAESGDTALLRVLADSIALVSRSSYYGRDWGLSRHVEGLILERQGRHVEAAAAFRQSLWGVAGFTRSNARLAAAELAQGHTREAIAALRDAYAAPLDAMGRYQPRSELDYLMALAFRQAGQADSAARYLDFARTSWRDADPEPRVLLDELAKNQIVQHVRRPNS
ncbi:MAG: BTAD domain-containing putative transcriptional regulator [Gemmatimonadales bacterium]